VNPQVAKFIELLKAMESQGAPPLWQLSPQEARLAADTMIGAAFNDGGPIMADTRDFDIPGRRRGIMARLYIPEDIGESSPGLLFLHGGGWVLGSPDTHDRLARELAVGVGARVLSIAYALAPEHPYPEGLDDCVDAARWLGTHSAEIGIDVGRLFIGGDSAGGNLAAATLLRLKQGGGPTFRAAIYIYGAFALTVDTPSMQAWGDRDLILSHKVMDWFRCLYLGGDAISAIDNDPYAAPIHGDLRGLPPAVLVVGSLDPLQSDSEMFAAALTKAGVETELHVFDDAPHAFAQIFMLDMAADAIARISAFARARI
jgi:acetyl esterase